MRGYTHVSNTGPGGSWISTDIPGTAGQGNGDMAMALDSNGFVHVIYTARPGAPTYFFPMYVTNKPSGTWTAPAPVTSTGWSGFGLSLAIDASDVIHVAWQEGSSSASSLVYVNSASGPWTPNIVQSFPSGGPGSVGTAIAISPVDGSVNIAYNDMSNGVTLQGLRCATNASGSWVSSTVDKDAQYSKSQSIAIDPSGTKYITYVAMDQNFKLSIGNGSAWTIYAIDLVESIFSSNWSVSNGLVLDSNNKVHIGYYDAVNQDMKYATNAP